MGYRVVTVKRRLTQLVLFLLLGAIVNVAVAWALAIWMPFHIPSGEIDTSRDVRAILVSRLEVDANLQWYSHERLDIPGFGWVQSELYGLSVDELFFGLHLLRSGWPMQTLRGEWQRTPKDERHKYSLPVPGRPSGIGAVSMLPLRPIWPGFAINTIFYAAILWLLTLGPFTARRFIRRKRSYCIKCGYDLRGTSGGNSGGGGGGVCPECGATTL